MELCSLASGSKANAYYISAQNTEILVDCGLSVAEIEKRLFLIGKNPQNIKAIFLTHEHSDHVAGVVGFCAKYGALLFVHRMARNAIAFLTGKIDSQIRTFDTADFYFEALTVSPFLISHDAAFPVGFSFYSMGKKVTIMIDTGVVTADMLAAAAGCNAIVLEANHDVNMLLSGSYPAHLKRRILGREGHLSNDAAAEVAEFLAGQGTQKIILGHLSQKNNLPELAKACVYNKVCEKCEIYVASQSAPTKIFEI